jgi:hypothetical protein
VVTSFFFIIIGDFSGAGLGGRRRGLDFLLDFFDRVGFFIIRLDFDDVWPFDVGRKIFVEKMLLRFKLGVFGILRRRGDGRMKGGAGNNFGLKVQFSLGLVCSVRELLTFENLGTRVLTFS